MRVLGFDPGAKKTGIAIGNQLTQTAEPLETWIIAYRCWGDATFDQKLQTLISTWKPTAIVVGMAQQADGQISAQQKRCQHFCKLITALTTLPVHAIDERLSSHAAHERLKQLPKRQQHVGLDALAAAVIIETYLAEL